MRHWLALALLALLACDPAPAEPAPASTPPGTVAARATVAVRPTVRFVHAEAGDLTAVVRAARETAALEGRTLLVYVGAPWCEPCGFFHQAVDAGRLEGKLPPLLLLELDRDVDEARLAEAGYLSRLIPLFAVPGVDGRAGPLRMEGSIKGEGAVDEILPRLTALVARANSLSAPAPRAAP